MHPGILQTNRHRFHSGQAVLRTRLAVTIIPAFGETDIRDLRLDSRTRRLLVWRGWDCDVDLADVSEDGEGLVEVVRPADGEDLDLVGL